MVSRREFARIEFAERAAMRADSHCLLLRRHAYRDLPRFFAFLLRDPVAGILKLAASSVFSRRS